MAAVLRVLLIEDDLALGEAVRDQVAADGHAVDWVQRLSEARDHARVVPYDLLLLDLMLPDGPGLEFLRERRREGDVTPVMILTARDQISERIAGLNAGADDYLVKPFNLLELSARVSAVARRYAGNPNPLVRVGALEIDLAAHAAFIAGHAIDLTAREWGVLEALVQHPGAIISKGQLEDHLYAFGGEVESNTIEAYVSRLRKKLGPDVVQTVRGLGYRLGRG